MVEKGSIDRVAEAAQAVSKSNARNPPSRRGAVVYSCHPQLYGDIASVCARRGCVARQLRVAETEFVDDGRAGGANIRQHRLVCLKRILLILIGEQGSGRGKLVVPTEAPKPKRLITFIEVNPLRKLIPIGRSVCLPRIVAKNIVPGGCRRRIKLE